MQPKFRYTLQKFGGLFMAIMLSFVFAPIALAGPPCTTDCYVNAATGDDANGGASPGDAKKTIQAAINQVDPNGTVHVADGTYPEAPNVNKNGVTIDGQSKAGTIIDASSFGGYSFAVTSDDVTLQDFTLKGNPAGTYGIKAAGPSPNRMANFTVQNVVVDSSRRTGVDLNGVDGALIKDVEVKNVPSGNGLSATDSNNVTFENITTSNTAWGGLAIYTYGRYFSLGSDNITLQGTNNFGDANKVYVQRGNYNNPAAPQPITNLTVNGFAYTVMNDTFRPGGANFTFYQITRSEAIDYAIGLPTPKDSYVNQISNGHFWVGQNGSGKMSIQTAIDHASANDTINVLNGVYEENIDVNKAVSLIGQGSSPTGTVLRKLTNSRIVKLSASGTAGSPILLKDIRIEPEGFYGLEVHNGDAVEYLTLDNVDVYCSQDKTIENEVGLKIATDGSLAHFEVKDSAFDYCDYGWYFAKHGDWGPGGSNVSQVMVDNTTFNHNSYKGLYIEKLTEATFKNSFVVDNGSDPFWNSAWNAGVDINLKGKEGYKDITFTNMTITGNGLNYKEGAGLMIKARDDGGTYGAHPATLDNVLIENSTVTGNERGIRLGEPNKNNAGPTNVVIRNNNIISNVQTYAGNDGSEYGGVINQSQTQVDAVSNWWGDASGPDGEGPGTGDRVSTQVTFCPWLDGPFPGGSLLGGVVALNTDTSESFCSIQAAIQDSDTDDGDTIQVLAGTFVEDGQIVINKDLTIKGDSTATTLVKTNQDSSSSGDSRGWWLVESGKTLNLSDLTLDGDGHKVYQAIRHKGSGTVDQVAFKNIKFNESGPHYNGTGVAAFGTGSVDVSNSEFSDMGRIGVLYYGAGVSGSKFMNNVYVGKGVGDWLDYALDISNGAVVQVEGNTISGNRGVARSDGSTSAGILVSTFFGPGTKATIEKNNIRDNYTGITVGYNANDTSVVIAHDNNITGNDKGVSSTAPSVDATKNWWGDASGPDGEGPGTGDRVSKQVLFCPWYDDVVGSGSLVHGTCSGKITLIKDVADGTDNEDFSFNVYGYNPFEILQQFNLDDDGDNGNDLSNTKVIELPGGRKYGFSEAAKAGWHLMGLNCTSSDENRVFPTLSYDANNGGQGIAVDDIQPGEEITCTFVNKRKGQVMVSKYKDDNGNGVRDEAETMVEGWQMAIFQSDGQGGWTRIQPSEHRTNGMGLTHFTNLDTGRYLVCEEQRDGWYNVPQAGQTMVEHDGWLCQQIESEYGKIESVVFGNRPAKLSPVLECVYHPEGYNTAWALWGYDNTDVNPVNQPFGADNQFTPAPQNQGQPTAFLVGRQTDLFWTPFSGGNLVWTLKHPLTGQGGTATAGWDVNNCGDRLPPPTSLTIVKKASEDRAEPFGFNGDLGPFSLERDESISFERVDAGTYHIHETDRAALADEYWTVVSVMCVDAKTSQSVPEATLGTTPEETAAYWANLANYEVNISLKSGQQLICTFNNNRADVEQPASSNSGTIYLPFIGNGK